MFNFENWFLCQFSSTTWFFLAGLSQHPKIGKHKKEFTNINLRGCKTKKTWRGGVVTDKTGLRMFVFINAMIFAFRIFVTNTPLYGKNASEVWKNIFQISLKKGPPPDSTFWNICNCLLNSFRAKKLLCYIWFGYIDLWASEQNVRLEWNGCSGPDSIQWIPFRLSRLLEHLRC